MKRCRHKNRDEAMSCIFYRSHKAERIPPLHGPNEFRWQTTDAQEEIMGSIAHFDPWPADIKHVFAPIRRAFCDVPEWFAEDLFKLRGMGLVWIDCDSELTGYTEDGRQHMEEGLAELGGSLAGLRLFAQANGPSRFNYGPVPLIDRIGIFLALKIPAQQGAR